MSQLDAFNTAASAVHQDPATTARSQQANLIARLREYYVAGRVADRDQNFASNLLNSAARYGSLTSKQMHWVGVLVERVEAPPALPAAPIQVTPVKGIIDLLQRARNNGLKFPKLWLKLTGIVGNIAYDSDLRFSIAGEKSKYPGTVVMTDGEAFGSNKYFGRISTDGQLSLGRDGNQVKEILIPLLNRLGQEPATVAAEFGHLTGYCCFCSRPLSDERSTAVGYGKTCAGKFGLPWGKVS